MINTMKLTGSYQKLIFKYPHQVLTSPALAASHLMAAPTMDASAYSNIILVTFADPVAFCNCPAPVPYLTPGPAPTD